ncbi:DNA repair protein RAD7 [Fistulifera solaris]|uniref:DNA repair protein RAD7 n=1 Tax=Fistulifera solaris TaxID=1519565 RepID=A0A1Z5KHN2_FISSO|nr:DNA repair protein RAD7 [Fistulifera solaris]|eukprot:GAX25541.1 DNA repair protein RAD7 [Fistulifera solaris]
MAPSRRHNNNHNNAQPRVAEHIRERQRAVAEREASRLARPDVRAERTLGHADRTKSAVTSTPFGILTKKKQQETQEEWCGPFSVARQMIAQREAAKRKRLHDDDDDDEGEYEASSHPLDSVMKEFEEEQQKKIHPSMSWKGRPSTMLLSSSGYAKRRQRATLGQQSCFPTLLELCVDFVVQHFEHVDSLGDVDSSIRSRIAHALVARGKLNNNSLEALAEKGVETLELIDCSHISPDHLKRILHDLIPGGLRYLVLDQCGRCFGTAAVQALVNASRKTPNLRAVSIGGAYLLKDDTAADLVTALAPTVTSLEFKACPLLGSLFCQALRDSFYNNNTSNQLLELTLEDIPLTVDHFDILLSAKTSLRFIRNLSLQRLANLNDDIVEQLLPIMGPTLEGLDLSQDYHLTDRTLGAIREYCPTVHSLTLNGLRLLTAEGFEALFTVVENMTEPPMLRRFQVNQCDHEAITDQVVLLAAKASTHHRADVQSHSSGGSSLLLGGLKHLDIQGSSLVTDEGLEELVRYCAGTLEELNVSFCPKISSKGLGYLVDQMGPQLHRLLVWGLAQLGEEFWDGHKRANDPTLDISGAWMRKYAWSGDE